MFDEHSNWRAAEEAYEQLKFEDASCAKRLLVVGHGDDKEHAGLQMADLMAHEARLKTKQKWQQFSVRLESWRTTRLIFQCDFLDVLYSATERR